MKFGKKLLVLICTFFVSIISIISFAAGEDKYVPREESECFPEYECGNWGECINGLLSRTCEDKKCGGKEIIERKICETGTGCRPLLECDDWSTCDYSEKIEDFFSGKISFVGYKSRFCKDSTGCADSFIEEEPCKEEYSLELKKTNLCGKEYLLVIDNSSRREIARIDLEEWKNKKIDIVFNEGKTQYCSTCFDNIKNGDETGIDCGGSCRYCKEEKSSQMDITKITAWAFALFFFFASIYEVTTQKKEKLKDSKLITK